MPSGRRAYGSCANTTEIRAWRVSSRDPGCVRPVRVSTIWYSWPSRDRDAPRRRAGRTSTSSRTCGRSAPRSRSTCDRSCATTPSTSGRNPGPMLWRSSSTNRPSIARPSCASDGATAFGKMYFSMNAVPWRKLRLFAIVWIQRDARWAPCSDRSPYIAVILRPDMLHHADRHDAIERAADVAVVAQPQLDRQVLPQLRAERDLILRQRDADDAAAVFLRPPSSRTRPSHSRDRARACRTEADLARDEIELGFLRLGERLRVLPVAAGVCAMRGSSMRV